MLIKLRNPWCTREWKGDWSDLDSKNWNDRLRNLANFKVEDDGFFYMSVKDYLHTFEYTTVGALGSKPQEWKHTWMVSEFTEKETKQYIKDPIFVEFTLEEPIDTSKDLFAITVSQ